jgi:hypothetical protein
MAQRRAGIVGLVAGPSQPTAGGDWVLCLAGKPRHGLVEVTLRVS